MKDFWEKFKDFLHHFIDYILIIGIIGVVVIVIGWRLDHLFEKGTGKKEDSEIVMEHEDTEKKPVDSEIEDDGNSTSETDDEEVASKTDEEESKKDDDSQIIHIEIPPGSVSYQIGQILKENGLVEQAMDFVDKAVELNLETKLRAGEYDIERNSSIEDILNIITKP